MLQDALIFQVVAVVGLQVFKCDVQLLLEGFFTAAVHHLLLDGGGVGVPEDKRKRFKYVM